MKKKVVAITVIGLFIAVVGFYLVQRQILYASHEALAIDAVAELLEKTNQQLPKKDTNLTMISRPSAPGAGPFYRIAAWQLEGVELKNVLPILQSILDDDPVYSLSIDLRVAFTDGSESTLSLDSWRYGWVAGPAVFNYGDGPPGHLTAALNNNG